MLLLSCVVHAQAPPAASPSQPPQPPGQTAPAPPAAPAQTQPPAAVAPSAPTPAQIRYEGLVERVKNGDLTVDLGELRESFTETPAYRAMMMTAYQALWTPLNRKDFEGALQIAEKVLGTNYVEINAHMVASIAHQQLGNAPRADYHRTIANGLLKVVMSKGDGATAETAWVVIDISEEYAVMRALSLSMQSQGLSVKDGTNLDVLQVIDMRTKEPRTLYFNVDRSMAAMTRGRAQK
jgi:hypothetical protein